MGTTSVVTPEMKVVALVPEPTRLKVNRTAGQFDTVM
jgi:hypothetical protein